MALAAVALAQQARGCCCCCSGRDCCCDGQPTAPHALLLVCDCLAACCCADVIEGGETAFPDSNHWVDKALPAKLGPFSPCAAGSVAFKPKKVGRAASCCPMRAAAHHQHMLQLPQAYTGSVRHASGCSRAVCCSPSKALLHMVTA